MNAKWYCRAPLIIAGICTAMSAAAAQKLATTGTRGQIVAAGNSGPVRDSRGNIVISDPAVAPPGSNPGVGEIGPIRDPRVIFAPKPSTKIYRKCSRLVTDNCVQLWEPPSELPNCPGDPECPQIGDRPKE